MTTVNIFVNNIIINGSAEEQTNFLKVAPVIELKLSLVNYWIDICEKNYHDISEELKFSILMNKYYELKKHQQHILNFLKIGLKHNYIMPNNDACQKIIELLKLIHSHQALKLLNYLQKKILTENAIPFFGSASSEIEDDCVLSQIVCFNDIHVDEFIAAINNYHVHLFNNISSQQLVKLLVEDTNLNLARSVRKVSNSMTILGDMFNKISKLIPTEIVIRAKTTYGRINIIRKFISIAEKFLEAGNFEALFAVVIGLDTSVLRRLNLWLPDKKHTIQFNTLWNIISYHNDFYCYRNMIKNKPKYIPHIGLVINDLDDCLQLDNIHPDANIINVKSYNTLVEIVNSFTACIPPININTHKNLHSNIIDFVNNYKIIDEDGLHDIVDKLPKKKLTVNKEILINTDKSIDKPTLSKKISAFGMRSRSSSLHYTDKNNTFSINNKNNTIFFETPMHLWTVEQISEWLIFIELEHLIRLVKNNEITGILLIKSNHDNLTKMGVSNEKDRNKILDFIATNYF